MEPARPARLSGVEPQVDLQKLPAAVKRILDPATPAPLRQMAAKGMAPGLKPGDALTVVALLSESADADVATAARATLEKLPSPLLNGALAGDLPPGVLALIAPRYATNLQVMEKLLAHPAIPPQAVVAAAAVASEAVAELVATNEQRLLQNPEIIEKLYLNKSTRMSTADRILELAVRNNVELHGIAAYKEAAQAIGMELIAEPSDEPTPDDVAFKEVEAAAAQVDLDPETEDTHELDEETGQEKPKEKVEKVAQKFGDLTISQKIRQATIGDATARGLALRDSNRLVSSAAIKSPKIQENEVVRAAANRSSSEDVLRIIATSQEWAKSHQIKLNLVQNPRTPFTFASKLIGHLREGELKQLAKSKNVSGAVATAARQQLLRRNVKS
jgi:hypothetical protein